MQVKPKHRPPISYYGGKQIMAKHILPLIPPHRIYTEPFFGGGAIEEALVVYNYPKLFDPVKRAWAFWILTNQGYV